MAGLTRREMGVAAAGLVVGGLAPGSGRAEEAEVSMADSDALHVPAQDVPPPKSLSPEATAFLAEAAKRISASADSADDGQRTSDQAEAALEKIRPAAKHFQGSFETIDLGSGAQLYRADPKTMKEGLSDAAFLDIHGGGFVSGGGEMCALRCKLRASDYRIATYSVDYRLAPDHPYPAALEDCVAAYKEVLKQVDPRRLVVCGASAGGNLAAALLLRAWEDDVPLPAGLMLMTPALDMTRAGDTYRTNRFLDVTLYGGSDAGARGYSAGHDPTDPYLSPLFGDIPDEWPPTILTSGTRDLLLSDTVRMHRLLRKAGVRAELHVQEAGPHGGFMGQAPEDRDIIEECRRFLYEALGSKG
jgi:acetyl esterase/lipase